MIYVSQFNSLEVNAFEEWNHWLNLIYNPLRLFQVSSIGCRKIVHALKIVFKPPGMAIRIFCQKTGSADPQFSVRILWILVKLSPKQILKISMSILKLKLPIVPEEISKLYL